MPTTLDQEVKDFMSGKTQHASDQHMVMCQICGTFRPKKVLYDGSGESVLCDKCLAKNPGVAYLMCRRCGKFLGFYKPGKVRLDSGVIVEIEPGDTLHTTWCSHCNPREPAADIEEFKAIMAQKNLNAPKATLLDPTGKPIKVEGM
jgi:hypothetical protein